VAGSRFAGPRPGGRLRGLATLAVLVLATLLAGAAPAPDSPSLEYQVKAAFLYQFLSFVEWPAPALAAKGDSRVVGILGDTPMVPALQALGAKPVQGRPLVVRHFRDLRDLREPGALYVLFVAQGDRERLAAAVRAVKGSGVLTVGESEGFARLGGIINFVIVDGKVGFEINPRAADEAGLRVSSKLLQLARIVEDRS
jgi:hypothetical protein